MMDLCLPDHWETRSNAVFRDDLGPQKSSMPSPQAFVCGLRDWRAPAASRSIPICGTNATRTPPRLVPYHAPDSLRGTPPA